MGNFDFGKSLEDYDKVFSYSREPILNLFSKYYNNDIRDADILANDWYSKLDSLLLYSFIREKKFKNILEIGGGTTTNIMLNALEKNANEASLSTYCREQTQNPREAPTNVNFSLYQGNFLDTFEENKPNMQDVDLCFIDGDHEAYFSAYYIYEILEKLPSGAIIHIHDLLRPDGRGSAKEYYSDIVPLPTWTTLCDEHFVVYLFLKNNLDRYKILCDTNNLIHNELKSLEYIHGVSEGLFIKGKRLSTAPAQSLWLEVL